MSRKLVEAALFMSSRAMAAEEISKITGVTPANVEKILQTLSDEYASDGKGVEVIRVPEGWEMRVRPELLPKVAHLTHYSDLRDGHKRTLALVAYREPLKQSDAVRIQGNKVYNYIKFLRKKGLIKSEKAGRTIKLSVTKEFERYFGLEKDKIKEMLQRGMDKAKARDDAKALRAAQEASAPKSSALTQPVQAPASATTPPTNVQYIETASQTKTETGKATKAVEGAGTPQGPAEAKAATGAETDAMPVIKALKMKPSKRRGKKLGPAAKIGTRRPAS
jgi:segregation and condensation protein B